MAIRFQCTACKQKLSVSSLKAGGQVRCPACGEEILVPAETDVNESHIQDAEAAQASAPGTSAPEPPADDDPRNDPVSGAAESWFTQPVASVPDTEDIAEEVLEAKSPPKPPQENRRYEDDDEGDDGADDGLPLSFRRSRTESDGMDLTPMVDVTFLLLIFFMVTASFTLQKTIQVPPPDPEREGATQTLDEYKEMLDASIQVRIDAQNAITIDDEPLSDLGLLAEVIMRKSRDEKKSELVLIPQKQTHHAAIVGVVDAATEAGLERIRVVSPGDNSG